jgi:transglutaminase-like putative cysteine protease
LIEHETRLDFQAPVQEHHCEMRVMPRESVDQRVIAHEMDIDPPAALRTYQDAFGNTVVYFNIITPHRYLITRVRSEVETLLENPFNYQMMSSADETKWYADQIKLQPELQQYILHQSPATPALDSLDWGELKPPKRDLTQSIQSSLLAAVRWVHETLRYQPGSTQTHTPLCDSLKARTGVCADFAHMMITIVRSWHIPARYVMGYMRASVEGYDDSRDEEATHAWAEILIPGAGWRGFDPTNKLITNHLYIPVAVGRDYLDAAPQRGTFKGSAAQETPKVRVILQEQTPQQAPPAEQQKQVAQ